jgi:hypothetical protein
MNAQPAPQQTPSLHDYLAAPLRLGDADVAGPLAVFPIFGPPPVQRYLPFAPALEQGFRLGEVAGGGSVNNLVVENPTMDPVLLFEGEEVLGAQQNRTFDVSVLVAPGARLRVPVSCVEAGRWEGSRNRESFRPAPQSAYPALRRAKAREARRRAAGGLEARADQGAVWNEVAAKSERMGVASATGAMNDIYEGRRGRLAEMHGRVRLRDGQLGALAAIGGRVAVLDYVSRPEVFATLHGPLVQGYALDALEAHDAEPPRARTARGFALLVTDCEPAQRNRGVGLGQELRFAAGGVAGTALVKDGELVQLTAFPGDDSGPDGERPARGGRIRRPSRRR